MPSTRGLPRALMPPAAIAALAGAAPTWLFMTPTSFFTFFFAASFRSNPKLPWPCSPPAYGHTHTSSAGARFRLACAIRQTQPVLDRAGRGGGAGEVRRPSARPAPRRPARRRRRGPPRPAALCPPARPLTRVTGAPPLGHTSRRQASHGGEIEAHCAELVAHVLRGLAEVARQVCAAPRRASGRAAAGAAWRRWGGAVRTAGERGRTPGRGYAGAPRWKGSRS